MEALSLNKALELYEILGPHIPEVNEYNDAWDFIGKIIDNINSSEDHSAYSLSIEIMTGKTLRELHDMNSNERLDLFGNGLIENKILDLQSFCELMGF